MSLGCVGRPCTKQRKKEMIKEKNNNNKKELEQSFRTLTKLLH